MARYFAQPRAAIVPEPMTNETVQFDNWPMIPELHVADFRPTDTGLIDLRGDPIMRAPNPVGFGKDNEW
jgi:hypothetical protein